MTNSPWEAVVKEELQELLPSSPELAHIRERLLAAGVRLAARVAAQKDAEQPHRCCACGLRWTGKLSGAELCGDCWRAAWARRAVASPVPEACPHCGLSAEEAKAHRAWKDKAVPEAPPKETANHCTCWIGRGIGWGADRKDCPIHNEAALAAEQPESASDEEETPHAFVRRSDDNEIWCRDCEYHADHPVHRPVRAEQGWQHASLSLARSLPDVVLEALREVWGNTNVAVVRHWRDEVLKYLPLPPASAEPKP